MIIPEASPEQADACSAAAEEALDRITAAALLPTPEQRRGHIAIALQCFEQQAEPFEEEDKWVYERWRFAFVMALCGLMHLDAAQTAPQDHADTFFSLEAHNTRTGDPVDLGQIVHGDAAAEGQAIAFQLATCALNGQHDTCQSLWTALMDRPQDEGFTERAGYAILLLSYLAARVRLKLMYRKGSLPEELKAKLELVMAQEPFGDLGP